MKRFHVHLRVADLSASIAFYSRLFAAEPARVETDYAKWMLDDPRVNFAISTRGGAPGLDHLGFQAETDAELADLAVAAHAADSAALDQGETTCCYARSAKHWAVDPSGVAWEHFRTLGDVPLFGVAADLSGAAACCGPSDAAAAAASCAPAGSVAAGSHADSACCTPATSPSAAACCTPVAGTADSACCTPAAKPLSTAAKPRVRAGVCGSAGTSSCC